MDEIRTADFPLALSARVDEYWANFFSCSPAELRPASTTVIRSANSPGLTALRTGAHWLIGLHPDTDQAAAAAAIPLLEKGDPADRPTHDLLHDLMRQQGFESFYGPSELLYMTADMLIPYDTVITRPLTPADTDIIDGFRVGMGGVLDWKVGDADWPYVIGHFDGETLISAAAVYDWGHDIAETYVDTLPSHRGRGLANALTYEITRWIVQERGWIAQAGGEIVNTPSGRISRRLGYRLYGTLFMNNLARA